MTGPASGSPSGTFRNPYSDPSITQVGNSVVIAAAGPNETLWMFWQQIGTSGWHAEQVPASYVLGQPSVAQVGQSTVTVG